MSVPKNVSVSQETSTTRYEHFSSFFLFSFVEENRNMLDRAKFYDVCGKEWLFPTIQDAVHHAQYNSTLVSLLIALWYILYIAKSVIDL